MPDLNNMEDAVRFKQPEGRQNVLFRGKIKSLCLTTSPCYFPRPPEYGDDLEQCLTITAKGHVTSVFTDDDDRVFIWGKEQDPGLYNVYREAEERAIEEISSQEIINAAYVAIKENGSMFRNELQRDVAQRFDCRVFTKKVEGIISYAVEKALNENILKIASNGKVAISRK